MVGRTREEFLERLSAVTEAKTAVILAAAQLNDAVIDFVNWSVPARGLQTDVTALVRELFLEN